MVTEQCKPVYTFRNVVSIRNPLETRLDTKVETWLRKTTKQEQTVLAPHG